MSDQFSASTELDLSLPTGQPSELTDVPLLSFDVLASASLELPGLRVNIEKLAASVTLNLRLDPARGLISVEPPIPNVRQPQGMGVELMIPPFSGGGHLEKFGDKELRGAFAASLGVIKVSALGVLGLDKFSMLVLLAGEFTPPLQLSFGFTLAGVGGLVGINRRVDENQITAVASSGELSHLLFPRDLLGEAPRLLDVLSRCFPYEDGAMIIGPMVKVGWGTPTIMSATVAVIVSTADAKAIILGRLAITLPFEATPLIYIEALIKGDFDQNGVRIDATLTNSHIAGIPVDGELRLRLITSPKPLFALAVGGFYPGYPVPDGMAGMRRLSATLSPSPYQIRLEAYAAITTASVQFGARLELMIGFDGFAIHGFGEFDAFFTWEPYFAFATELSASVSIECADFDVAGIRLNGEIGGASPWRLRGSATVSFLLLDISIDLPVLEFGPNAEERLPPAPDPLESLTEALKRPENWTVAPDAVPQIVILRGGPGSATAVHPRGVIGFRQRSVPLDKEIQRCAGALLPRPVKLQVRLLDHATMQPVDPQKRPPYETAEFVPSQFFDQDKNARLTQTGFVNLPAGFDIERTDLKPPEAVRDCDHEVKQLRAEPIWAFKPVPLKRMTLIQGVLDRLSLKTEPLVTSHNPHMQVVAPSAGFTDAAGRALSKIAAWELQP